MNILKTIGLTKKYGKNYAIDNVDLTINEGDIYGFIGENGAGKTTLIRLVCGMIVPTAGTYQLFDGNFKIGEMGAIVETPSLYPYFNAVDNLKQAFILNKRKDYGAIPELLESVGLADQIKSTKKTKNFSLGMKQRLGIAIALATNPKFLILDEPMNGLDPEGIVEMRNLILKLNKEKNVTFLISSHILSELAKVATNYCFIHEGVVIKEISAEELENKSSKHLEIKLKNTDKIEINLKDIGIEKYKVDKKTIYIYDSISINKITSELQNKGYEIESFNSVSTSIENYYLSLIGGAKDEFII